MASERILGCPLTELPTTTERLHSCGRICRSKSRSSDVLPEHNPESGNLENRLREPLKIVQGVAFHFIANATADSSHRSQTAATVLGMTVQSRRSEALDVVALGNNSRNQSGCGMDLLFDFREFAGSAGDFDVVKVLQVEPELRVRVEVTRQAQSCLGSDTAASMHNFSDAGCWHVEFERELVDGKMKRLHEVLAKDFAGMDRRHESPVFFHVCKLLASDNPQFQLRNSGRHARQSRCATDR